MSIDSKQLHNLSRIYREKVAPVSEGAGKGIFKKGEIKGTTKGKKPGDVKLPNIGGKKIQAEGVYDTVKTVMDKGSNFVKKNPVGKALGAVVAPVKGNTGKNLPTAASQKAKGLRTEENISELDQMGGKLAAGLATGVAVGGLKLVGAAKKAGQNLKKKMQKRTTMPEEKMAKKDYDGDGKVESSKDEYFGSKDKAIKKAMGKKIKEGFSDWRHDLKEIPNYEQIPLTTKQRNEKISEKTVKNSVKINPTMEEGYGDKKKKKHDCASKVKHEEYGVGDCISEAHDLDENGNVAHYDVEFEEYIVKGVPVEELQILEKHMHEHVIHAEVEEGLLDMAKKAVNKKLATAGRNFKGGSVSQTGNYAEKALKSEGYQSVKEGVYEKKKKEEVMGALKKRDLKDKVKKKIAADIVKRKGDTSKSDDRYAYESKLWDEVAENLTQLGELNDADFRVEGYQRNPERDTRSARQRRMDDPDRGINSPAFRAFMAAQQGGSKSKKSKKKEVKKEEYVETPAIKVQTPKTVVKNKVGYVNTKTGKVVDKKDLVKQMGY